MEPSPMSTKQQHEKIVEEWMLSSIRGGGIDRYDDLHIDKIEEKWRDRTFWLNGGLQAFEFALLHRGRHSLDVTVVLAYSLQSGKQQRGIDSKQSAALQ